MPDKRRIQEAKTVLSITRPRALRKELVAGLISPRQKSDRLRLIENLYQ